MGEGKRFMMRIGMVNTEELSPNVVSEKLFQCELQVYPRCDRKSPIRRHQFMHPVSLKVTPQLGSGHGHILLLLFVHSVLLQRNAYGCSGAIVPWPYTSRRIASPPR